MTAAAAASISLPANHRETLLHIAKESVRHGLDHRRPLPIDAANFDPVLQETRATFVTLHIGAELRGCIGMLDARRPLVADVADNAFAAAFHDARFLPLTDYEFLMLRYHISILSPRQAMDISTQEQLLSELRPGIDGLILEERTAERTRRATFLPDVWQQVSDPVRFLTQLKSKGGWPADYWSSDIKVWRYTTESFE